MSRSNKAYSGIVSNVSFWEGDKPRYFEPETTTRYNAGLGRRLTALQSDPALPIRSGTSRAYIKNPDDEYAPDAKPHH
jgi:hypothetical protein